MKQEYLTGSQPNSGRCWQRPLEFEPIFEPFSALWSLAIYSFVFRDSAPKARYQNSLGQAKVGFGP